MSADADTPVDVVCLVLIDAKDRIYATRRPPGKALGGLWEFPGGKVDPGETPRSALQREIFEELGIAIEVDAPLTPVIHHYSFGAVRLLPYFGRFLGEASAIQLHEHTEGRWLGLPEARLLDWAPADVPILAELESGRALPS